MIHPHVDSIRIYAILTFTKYALFTLQGVSSELRLGFVDLDFECSTVCLTQPGLKIIWQKWLGKMVEHRNQS